MESSFGKPFSAALAVAAGFACVAAAPGPEALSCRVERAFNTSIAENLPVSEEPIRHRVADLKLSGETFTRTEQDHAPDFEAEVVHEIDRPTGRFVTTRHETRHDVGEHWVIRLTGTCEAE